MGSVASLVFYISAFLLSALFVYWGNKQRARKLAIILGHRRLVVNPALIIGVTIPILVSGFRQGVGTDFNNYVTEYNAASQSGSYLEIGFNIIASISHTLFGSPTFMFVVFSAMTVVPVMLAINKSSILQKQYRWLFWTLFLFIMFPQTFNLLRQGVSVAIGFYLIVSILESRKLASLHHVLYLLLAISFHSSACILLPICFIGHMMNNMKKGRLSIFVLASSIAAVISFSLLPQILDLLGGAWSGYFDKDLVSRSVVPRSILMTIVLMMCWKFYNSLKIANSYISLLWIGLLFNIGGLFVAYFERAGYYVTLLLTLLVIILIAQRVPKKQIRFTNSIICISALAYFVGIYYLMGSSGIFPYNWSV